MSRLNLQVFYLWHHVLSTAPPFILRWSNLEILFGPLHRSSPFIGGAALSSNSNGTRSIYSRKNPKAVYIVRCVCVKTSAWDLPDFATSIAFQLCWSSCCTVSRGINQLPQSNNPNNSDKTKSKQLQCCQLGRRKYIYSEIY
jgi:hypothetical protein